MVVVAVRIDGDGELAFCFAFVRLALRAAAGGRQISNLPATFANVLPAISCSSFHIITATRHRVHEHRLSIHHSSIWQIPVVGRR